MAKIKPTPTPKRGTLLYRCNWETDEIETYVFIEENIAEGASVPTWVIRKLTNFQRTRISKENRFRLTPAAALRDALLNLRSGIQNGRKAIAETKGHIKYSQARIKAIKLRLTAK